MNSTYTSAGLVAESGVALETVEVIDAVVDGVDASPVVAGDVAVDLDLFGGIWLVEGFSFDMAFEY